MTSLNRKDQNITWGPSQQEAFEYLNEKLCTTPVLAYPDFSQPFILTTDASNVAVATILSQVQDGVERPIAYASRQMNKAERAYAASEAEMLTLVWAVKYFRCCLFGRKFVDITDHSALTYLRKFADQNTRLTRWSLNLAELDSTIEHRPNKKIPHVDALSRLVGTVLRKGNLSPENLLQEQGKDKYCQSLKRGSYSEGHEFFRGDTGLINRRRPEDKHQLLVPRSLVRDVIKVNHYPVYAAHAVVKRTCDLIALSFWKPGMRKSVQEYVQKCDSCQRRKDD